jgi:hypothetical protein
MSQMRAMRIELRAIVAVTSVCALIFSLLIAGTMYRPRYGASHITAQQQDAQLATCHDVMQHMQAHGSSTPMNDGSHHTGCPGCCLASLASAAVLPERLATLQRPMRVASPISYYAFSAHEPETNISSAVNGARAPPVLS